MDVKLLIPLVGVVLGWLLSELSKLGKDKAENKKTINKVIAELLILRYEIHQFNSFAQGAVNVYGFGPKAEKERQRVMNKHLITSEQIGKGFAEAYTLISGYNPLMAIEIGHQIASLRKMNDLKLDTMSLDPDIYKTFLSTIMEVHVEVLKHIEETILKLARSNNLILWYRIKQYLRDANFKQLGEWGNNVKRFIDIFEKV